MTRENMAIYLYTMARLACEPTLKIEFKLKTNTELRDKFSSELEDELVKRLDWAHVHVYPRTWEKSPDRSFTVYAGSWSNSEDIKWLKNTLERRKVELELSEWR